MLNLDLSNAKESSFGIIPQGEYNIVVDEAEIKETKSGTGEYINCKLKITDGEYEGKFLFTMFNIKNQNQKAVEIGLGQLKTFMGCAGLDKTILKNAHDLLGAKAVAVVKHKTDDYGEKAVVSYFKPFSMAAKISGELAKEKDLPF